MKFYHGKEKCDICIQSVGDTIAKEIGGDFEKEYLKIKNAFKTKVCLCCGKEHTNNDAPFCSVECSDKYSVMEEM